MPKRYEVNTHNQVLCYIPSGKVTENNQQQTQFAQDAGTCWFHSTKRLANATGCQLDTPILTQRYKLISAFRKKQSNLEATLLIAASLLSENYPNESIEPLARNYVLINRKIVAAHRFNFWLAKNITPYIFHKQDILFRQLKSVESDTKAISEYVERYRKFHPEATRIHNSSDIEAIVSWLKARNPYQSQLLEWACITADGLSKLGSTEFAQDWSQEPRRLLQMVSNPINPNLVFSERPAVIVLGASAEFTRPALELSVAEKQAKRTLALTEFNQKIRRETLAVFKMNPTTFSNAAELMERLKNQGPLILMGFYGTHYYTASPHALRNEDGSAQTIGTRQLLGWNKGETKQLNFTGIKEVHQIIVIGIKYNSQNPIRSHVIFIDPNDNSFPGEQRKAYVMSFERLLQNKPTSGGSITAHYSTSDNTSQQAYDRDVLGRKSSLLTYSAFAAAATALGATYVISQTLNNK